MSERRSGAAESELNDSLQPAAESKPKGRNKSKTHRDGRVFREGRNYKWAETDKVRREPANRSMRESSQKWEPRREPILDQVADLLFEHLDKNFPGWKETESCHEIEQGHDNVTRLFSESPAGILRTGEQIALAQDRILAHVANDSSSSGSEDSDGRLQDLNSVVVRMDPSSLIRKGNET
ncbi:hypothetical protein NDN08_003408 [Rhodosorus marinus]|uniref:Ribosome assembly protein 3 n=1 Tax=Rhodosorus marinus TaxID=101924 RepID=A0AAV8UXZ7_9RHOD|nr:hypothetical protein NDN08_003408 [Rhodosorus marinus]